MDEAATAAAASQRSVRGTRRIYNEWVASEVVEDFALRYCPPSFRRWSPWLIANTANSSISALGIEAIGAAVLLGFGFGNAIWALLAALVINTVVGLPIAYTASRHNIDADLITRGAGFGYVGSTITSLIYAAFCFITFALQGAVMAGVLKLALGVPLWLGYIVCSAVIIPIVFHGISALNRMQLQLLLPALLLLALPVAFVLVNQPEAWQHMQQVSGLVSGTAGFDPLFFGIACGVQVGLVAQIGEQADYLRFLSPRNAANARAWWFATLVAGPGWFLLATIKQLIGMLLASALLVGGVAVAEARDPVQMYYAVYEAMLGQPALALAAVTLYVLIAQVRINVTNAYAGSLAWSNFFSRLTYSHPGRVVWLVMHIGVALLLMEFGVLDALAKVLGLYGIVAVAWLGAVAADLAINKPLGLSPSWIEFKRAHLHDFNPVGFGAMAGATLVASVAFAGAMGPMAQAYAWLISLLMSVTLAPLIAWATGGRYYIARPDPLRETPGRLVNCSVCGGDFVANDCAQCPFHGGPICSLCCTLESACKDVCKPPVGFMPARRRQLRRVIGWVWRRPLSETALTRVIGFAGYFAGGLAGLALAMELVVWLNGGGRAGAVLLYSVFAVLVAPTAVVAWLVVLGREGRDIAEDELIEKNDALRSEIGRREILERDLAAARDRAMALEQSKSVFLANMSHEIRTPMHAIIGMAHLAGKAASDARQRGYLRNISTAAGNLHRILDDVLDYSKIEAGKLDIEQAEFDLTGVLDSLTQLCATRAQAKGLAFLVKLPRDLSRALVGDALRLSQILLNFCTNAIKFTEHGRVIVAAEALQADEAGDDDRITLKFSVTDTGVGLTPAQCQALFDRFAQADVATARHHGGTGLGLAISKRLAQLMDGDVGVSSTPGAGSTFWATARFGHAKHLVSRVQTAPSLRGLPALLVDDDADARSIYGDYLASFGLQVETAGDAAQALAVLKAGQRPRLVVLDYMMLEQDGLALFETMRGLDLEPRPHVLMLTGAESESLRERAAQAGIDAYLTKPIGPSALFDCIIEFFGEGRPATDDLVATEAAARAQLSGRRILVAEDNEINQQVARGILEDLGIEVQIAEDGQRAVDRVEQARDAGRPIDLVLMDMQMPVMDGISATRLLRSRPAHAGLPIIAMTANAMDGARRACLDAGMNGHLGKPLPVKELLDTLMRWLPAPDRQGDPADALATMTAATITATAARPAVPEIEGLDTAAGVANVGGNVTRYVDALDSFRQRHADLHLRAADSMRLGERETALRHAHTLAGLLATLGARTLHPEARRFEQALRDDEADWPAHLEPLDDGMRALLAQISRAFQLHSRA